MADPPVATGIWAEVTLDQNEIKSNLWFMSYLLKKTIRLGPT